MADIDPQRDPNPTVEQMEARVARFDKLVPYKETMNTAHGIPVEAMRMMSTEKVFPVMSPKEWTGRSSVAPVKVVRPSRRGSARHGPAGRRGTSCAPSRPRRRA